MACGTGSRVTGSKVTGSRVTGSRVTCGTGSKVTGSRVTGSRMTCFTGSAAEKRLCVQQVCRRLIPGTHPGMHSSCGLVKQVNDLNTGNHRRMRFL